MLQVIFLADGGAPGDGGKQHQVGGVCIVTYREGRLNTTPKAM